MEIESDGHLHAYLRVCRHMRRLYGDCLERDLSESTPTLDIVEREQAVRIRVAVQGDDTVTVETSCMVTAPSALRNDAEDASPDDVHVKSLEPTVSATCRPWPPLDDKIAAALTTLNRPGGLVTYALDWPTSVKVSHVLLGEFVTETRLRRDVHAVACACARLEATSLRRDAASHRPENDIVDLVTREKVETLDREIRTPEEWSTPLDDEELPALDARLQRLLRRQFGGCHSAGPRLGEHLVTRYGHAVRLQCERHDDGLAISVSSGLVRDACLDGVHLRLLHLCGQIPLGAFFTEGRTIGFGYCIPADGRVNATDIALVVDHVAGTAVDRALGLAVRVCGVRAGCDDEPPDEPLAWF